MSSILLIGGVYLNLVSAVVNSYIYYRFKKPINLIAIITNVIAAGFCFFVLVLISE